MDEIIGVSAWAQDVRQTIARIAAYRSTVLITGPSGTGKELIARAIHHQSPRAGEPCVVVDCASIPPSLFASQLFGHVKGAFSGATSDTLGCFRAAEGGTIFLDEIGELSPELQVQLLRVIQQRTVVPVGSCREIPVDVRVLAATNRPLADEVSAGRFRLDLYYRLNVVRFQTLPLCQRSEDIPPLCRHFLAKLAIENGLPHKRLAPSALALAASLPWPGNVRQLHNVLERAMVFTQGDEITASQLQDLLEPEMRPLHRGDESWCATLPLRTAQPDVQPNALPFGWDHGAQSWPTLAEWECRLIEETLRRTFHNQRAAARLLETDRRVLARKIHKYGIAVPYPRQNQGRKAA